MQLKTKPCETNSILHANTSKFIYNAMKNRKEEEEEALVSQSKVSIGGI